MRGEHRRVVHAHGRNPERQVRERRARADGGELENPRFEGAVAIVERLRRLARELDTTPATLAMAFALSNPSVATVLFGATSPEQLLENVRAAELAEALDEDQLARLRAIDGGG